MPEQCWAEVNLVIFPFTAVLICLFAQQISPRYRDGINARMDPLLLKKQKLAPVPSFEVFNISVPHVPFWTVQHFQLPNQENVHGTVQ